MIPRYHTTTTDSNGHYIFTFLPPNEYIVKVDASNFTTGQALDSATSIVGATDPDDDINNDDNGESAVGFGTIALPVTLTSGGEPTNDGDDSEFTNLSIDFGFSQCIDVPEIQVSKESNTTAPILPSEAVSFTIRITNTGSVTITNLPLTDTYDLNYLTYDTVADLASPNQASDPVDDGEITWDNVIDFDLDNQLVPNETLILTVTFIAKSETTGASAAECASAGNTYNKAHTLGVESCIEISIDPPEPKSTIGDWIWHDINGDGIKSTNEPGINGVRVNLYKDGENGGMLNGTLEPSELLTFTITANDGSGLGDDTGGTNGAGFYQFRLAAESGDLYWIEVDASNFDPGGALEDFAYTGLLGGQSYAGADPRPVAVTTVPIPVSQGQNVDFGFYCRFDLALDKKLAAGQSPTISAGDDVTFTIAIYNQGIVTATNIVIADYIPAGFTLNDSNWNGGPTGTVTRTLSSTLTPSGTVGVSTTVDIVLTAGTTLSGIYTNTAEIAIAESLLTDLGGNSYPDADSDPDTDNTESPVKDDVLDENGKNTIGADEDDHDIATLTVVPINPTLAVGKTLNGNNPFGVGETIRFTIRITNTGDITITTLPLEDRFSSAFLMYDSATPTPSNEASGILTWIDLLSNDSDGLGVGEWITVLVTFTTAADTTLLSAIAPCTNSGHAPNLAQSIGAVGGGVTVTEDADDKSCDSVQILNPTAVTFTNQGIRQVPDGVLVQWSMADESSVVGFNILRSNGIESRQLNYEMIMVQTAAWASGTGYQWLDAGATLQNGDVYLLEIVYADNPNQRVTLDLLRIRSFYLPLVKR